MVITIEKTRSIPRNLTTLVAVYVGVVLATLAALAVMTVLGSRAATTEAWVHAAIVGVFALVLPLRLRAARRGDRQAFRAVAIIAGVLLVVNVVEALIPGLFPLWMRIEMIGIAVLMAALGGAAVRKLRG